MHKDPALMSQNFEYKRNAPAHKLAAWECKGHVYIRRVSQQEAMYLCSALTAQDEGPFFALYDGDGESISLGIGDVEPLFERIANNELKLVSLH